MEKRSPVYLLCGALFLCAVTPACGGSQKDSKTAGPVERVEGISETVDLFKKKDSTIEQLFSREADDLAPPTVEPCPTVFERLIADADCGVVE